MTLTSLLVPTYAQMLRTLAGLLDKAEAQRPDGPAEDLLAARLAPDMYPLASQIRFAAFQAQEAVYRLTDAAWPDSLHRVAAEGRDAGENPGTIAQARGRLDGALACLDGLAPDALDAGSGLAIALNLPDGLAFDLTGEQYARDWALPQFYFHVISAYAILRSQGIAIGKADTCRTCSRISGPVPRPGHRLARRPDPVRLIDQASGGEGAEPDRHQRVRLCFGPQPGADP